MRDVGDWLKPRRPCRLAKVHVQRLNHRWMVLRSEPLRAQRLQLGSCSFDWTRLLSRSRQADGTLSTTNTAGIYGRGRETEEWQGGRWKTQSMRRREGGNERTRDEQNSYGSTLARLLLSVRGYVATRPCSLPTVTVRTWGLTKIQVNAEPRERRRHIHAPSQQLLRSSTVKKASRPGYRSLASGAEPHDILAVLPSRTNHISARHPPAPMVCTPRRRSTLGAAVRLAKSNPNPTQIQPRGPLPRASAWRMDGSFVLNWQDGDPSIWSPREAKMSEGEEIIQCHPARVNEL